MAGTPTQGELWEAVRNRRRGVLATVASDGMPHLTNVHYLVDPTERLLRITTTADRVKGRNLLRDPRAALHVQHDDDWFAFTVIEGKASIAVAEAVGDAATDELHELFEAFRGAQARPSFDEQMIVKRRVIVRLSAERLYGLMPGSPT